MRFGIDLRKARGGFTRGRPHKYMRRVRTVVNGKLAWKYYYHNEAERKRQLKQLEKQATTDPKAQALLDDHEHGLMTDFNTENEVRKHKKRLAELTIQGVQDESGMENPAELTITEKVLADYHTALVDRAEPEKPHGQPMSVLRGMEMAYDRLPAQIKKLLDDRVGIDFTPTEDNAYMKRKRNVAGYARPGGKTDDGTPGGLRRGETYIAIGMERSWRVHGDSNRPGSGLWPIEVLIHEIGHAVHNVLIFGDDAAKEGWPGGSWQDYMDFYEREGKHERAVTSYARTNEKERWAESFASALLFPQHLAETAPKMYNWMRDNLLGQDALPPLETDLEEKNRLQAELERHKKDPIKVAEIRKKLDANVGILDMPPDHPAISWWGGKRTRLQEMLAQVPAQIYANERTEQTFHPKDKFYEMSVGGRTVYARIGPRPGKEDEIAWTPGGIRKVPGARPRLEAGQIKEVYTEDGKPIHRKVAFWHLHQDIIGEQEEWSEEDAKAKLVGREKGFDMADLVSLVEDPDNANLKMRNSFNLMDILTVVAKKDGDVLGRPVEISRNEFRQKSGAFGYDAWTEPGQHLIAKIQATQPGTEEYDKLMTEYRRHQPFVEFDAEIATEWHVKQGMASQPGQVVRRVYKTEGGVPVLTMKRFVNENPDGSHTIIDCERGPDGKYYPRSPIWRALLTPDGDSISSVEDMKRKCQQAMEAGLGDPPRPRRAWISVRGDTQGGKSDREHYIHMQLEFDGRGQPRVMGDEWRHRLGVPEPRLDDFLKARGGKDPETARPIIPVEKIAMGKPKVRKGSEFLPKPAVPETDEEPSRPGDRVVLRVSKKGDLGHKTAGEKSVIVRLQRILPGKKAGEAPPEPGWDRMPEGFDDPLPAPEDWGAFELTRAEKRLKKKGILPEWYNGSRRQRQWLDNVYWPAHEHWKKTKNAATKEEWAKRYVFIGEVGGGAPGKRIIRRGDREVRETMNWPIETPQPEPLEHTPLMYYHQQQDAITGEVLQAEMRMVLPRDGHIDPVSIEKLPGLHVTYRAQEKPRPGEPRAPKTIEHLTVDMGALPRLREVLGGFSLTSDAERMMRAHADQLREVAERAAEADHVMPLADIDPAVLARMGVGLRPNLSDGSKFELAHHQQELIQKLVDNGGRILGAHFMGTGKTVSAIAAAKLMMARRDPDHPLHDPNAPKKTLVVAPLNVVEQWRQAAFEFDEGATVVGASSSDIPVDHYLKMVEDGTDTNDLVIVGPEYFTLNEDKLKEAGFDALVVDEAHMGIRNENTARNKAIAKWNEDMKMMMLLTGTPITTSPADILEYIKILSKGRQWAGWTRKQLENEYLEESPVPGAAGVKGAGSGPKVQVKASKREELAAILARWTHVAMGKDVRGKTLPAVRMEENRHAVMQGMQSLLYGMQLAALSDAAKERIEGAGALAEDETVGLSDDARRRLSYAKAIANCVSYKPESHDQHLMIERETLTPEGKVGRSRVPFKTFGIDFLKKRTDIKNKRLRKLRAGHWPPVDELTPQEVAMYDAWFKHILDPKYGELTYAQVAGSEITDAQWKAMEQKHVIAGVTFLPWGEDGTTVENPDWGPLGIKCRGLSESRPMTAAEQEEAERAAAFRRDFQTILTTPVRGARAEDPDDPKDKAAKKVATPYVEDAWDQVIAKWGITEAEAQHLMGVPPERFTFTESITHGGVTVTTDDHWVSYQKGSLHLLYHPDDWDYDNERPKDAGGFAMVEHLDECDIRGNYAWLKRPKNVKAEDWPGPPRTRYRSDLGEGPGGKVAVEILDGPLTGHKKWVKKDDVRKLVRSLMDPGMRAERAKADVAMVIGNAKAEELMAYIENFHIHTGGGNFGPGEERGRSMVIFANGILDGCRTVEATLRVQGFRDVNEVLAGSPHHDPDDADAAPNGKYFVTYIGSTYTGDRELNIEISKKVKDKLGRDTSTSLFVHKTHEGRNWDLWPGGPRHPAIKRSQWTAEQRKRIHDQFKIRAPECTIEVGGEKRYFYGSTERITIPGEEVPVMVRDKRTRKMVPKLDDKGNPVMKPLTVSGTEGLLREMTLTGDPSKMAPGSAERKNAEARLKRLQALYEEKVREGTSDEAIKADPAIVDPPKGTGPMTARQINVMNNCEIMVLSDAAQVGINKGDAVEMVMYDSLASPMAEMQRITRSARMLPPAVRDELMNKYITKVTGLDGGQFSYAQLSENPEHPAYVAGAQRVDNLWNAMVEEKIRPPGMTYAEYRARAKDYGAEPEPEEAFKERALMTEDQERDSDRITWVNAAGEVAVTYTPRGAEEPVTVFVDPATISEDDGAFRRIRDQMEAGAFDPAIRGATVPGQGLGVSLPVKKRGEYERLPESTMTFHEILEHIATTAAEQADMAVHGAKGKPHRDAWTAVAARARMAQTLGVVSAAAALREFQGMHLPFKTTPGDTRPRNIKLLTFNGLDYQEPDEGTYSLRTAAERAAGVAPTDLELTINEPIEAIRQVLNEQLSDAERIRIAKAGFVKQGETFDPDRPQEAGALDATEIYLAMRAQQVMNAIERRRPEMARTMRATAGGKVVTEADIMNAVIDELSPMDRAILKSKKYLVNVRRIGASGMVPQTVAGERRPVEEGARPKKDKVFVGYEREHPVATERNTRAKGRARVIPVENLLHLIQQGVTIRSEMDYHEVHTNDIADTSRLDPIAKALRLVFGSSIFKSRRAGNA